MFSSPFFVLRKISLSAPGNLLSVVENNVVVLGFLRGGGRWYWGDVKGTERGARNPEFIAQVEVA